MKQESSNSWATEVILPLALVFKHFSWVP